MGRKTIYNKKFNLDSNVSPQSAVGLTRSQLPEDSDINRYGPFNHLTIINNTGITIQLRTAGANVADVGTEDIPPGTVIFDLDDGLQYNRVWIYNPSASATLDKDDVTLQVRKVVENA